MNGDSIVQWAQAHGSDAKSPRDAAHEGYHGWSLQAKVWDRESIHAEIMKLERFERARQEIEARAAEWLICDSLGIDYTLDDWVMISAMEAVRSDASMPFAEWRKGIQLARDLSSSVRRFVEMLEAECS